jgi:hypothetical protein
MTGNCDTLYIPPPIQFSNINIQVEERQCASIFDPAVWGEGTWLFLHAGSLSARAVPTPDEKVKYWGFIEGLALMLPCKACSAHAQAYVDNARPFKDQIVSNRGNLIQFFVDFHNSVNARLGKPEMTRSQVLEMMSGTARVCTIKYF